MKTSGVCFLVVLFVHVRAAPPGADFHGFGIGGNPPRGLSFGYGFTRSYDGFVEQTQRAVPSPTGRGSIFESLKPTPPAELGRTPLDTKDGFAVISSDVLNRDPETLPRPEPSSTPLFDFNTLFQQINPFSKFSAAENDSVVKNPQAGIASSFESLQQSHVSSGKSQGLRESMHDQGESNEKTKLGKEEYSTKEAFGHESSASHAIGASQDSAAQTSESSRHENGHRIQALSHGTNVLSSSFERPSMAGHAAFPGGETNSAVNNSQTLLASSAPQDAAAAFIPSPAASINGAKFSNGSRESSQTNSSNSSAYNIGSNNSKSFTHSESLGDKQAFVNGGANKHATQAQRGSESTQIDGSTSTNKFKETSLVQG